jgi:hypothetical protein
VKAAAAVLGAALLAVAVTPAVARGDEFGVRAPRAVASGDDGVAQGGDGRAAQGGVTVRAPGQLREPRVLDRPPPGRVRSALIVVRAAAALPTVEAARAEHPGSYARSYLRERGRWQVSFFTPAPEREEIAQVLIDDRSGRVLEQWTGIQVAWPMARGYPGQFGRAANAPWVWLGLCALFVLPFARPPWRPLHADLAALLVLSVSYAFFGAGAIEVSVPTAVPPLLWLLGRLLWVAWRRPPPASVRLLLPAGALAAGLAFLVGFRVLLNVVDGNVIDVGYAGVIGADRLLQGMPLWGAFPHDNLRGDTYGPALYLGYAPFGLVWPWSGTWDDLPAAHAAAVTFDLACMGGLALAGRRLGGPRRGLLLAYLWAACPWTLLVANSGSNDTLVGATVLLAFLLLGRPFARGAGIALAGLTKFAPLALGPLFATYGRSLHAALLTALGAAVAAALLLVPAVTGPGGLPRFWERTLGFQAGRDSPFSPWGLYGGLESLQAAVTLAAAALALAVAVVPRRRDALTVAALGAAVLLAVQLALDHWFYLYVAWWLPLALIALVLPAVRPQPAGRSTSSIEAAWRVPEQRTSTALIHGSSSEGS